MECVGRISAQKIQRDGVTDFNEIRAKKMWDDPAVKDEDLPSARFEYDSELKEMVFVGYSNEVKH